MNLADQAAFEAFESLRAERSLPKDMRWLTTDDTWQLGDEYKASRDEWWAIGGSMAGIVCGSKVPASMLCYTPRGKR